MSDEVRAAAERLRRLKAGELVGRVYRDEPWYQYERDIKTLAQAYLAEHADDGEVIQNLVAVVGRFLKGEATLSAVQDVYQEMMHPTASEQQHKSRSVLRREAAQRGEEAPDFSKHPTASAQENGLYKALLERSQELKREATASEQEGE